MTMTADPDLPDDRRRGRNPAWEPLLIVGGSLALAVLGFWWATLPPSRERSRIPAAARATSDREPHGRYAGSRVCAECHPGESALYPGSGHARTLRPAARSPLARRLDGRTVADPERPDVAWSYHLRDGEFHVERKEAGAVEKFIID